MKIKHIGLMLLIVLSLGLFYWWRTHKQRQQDLNILSTVLPKDDKEKIIIDPSNHRIDIITADGIKRETLPGMRPSSIEIKKDGSVVVTSPQWGFEHGVFVGGGFSNDGLRFGIGVDVFYYKLLDLGVSATDLTKDLEKPRISLCLSYTVWHETRISLGIDDHNSPNLFVTQRF